MKKFENLKIWKFVAFIVICLMMNVKQFAQLPTTQLRISILTCGAGEELYSTYGHTAIRVIDSSTGSDCVYNYGTFEYGDPQFYSKFARGKLPYYVNRDTIVNFMHEYIIDKRSVMEQVLNLDVQQTQKIHAFLLNNIKEENKYYKYDFLFDNCSTRIRDLLKTTLGSGLQYARVIADDSVSFRTYLNYYERNLHVERFGINLLMSNLVDEKMKNDQSFFLPDFLMKGIDGAWLNGKPLVKETLQLLPAKQNFAQYINEPKLIGWILLIAIALLSLLKPIKKRLIYFDVLFFMILGLLGCMMLFMWFGTEHKVCAWNRNLFWAFPLHLGFAYFIARKSEMVSRYARYASYLVIGSVIYGLFAKQEYIAEITPILILILFRLSTYSKGIRFSQLGNFGS
jgi:Domain of unknown function (DUF4105)